MFLTSNKSEVPSSDLQKFANSRPSDSNFQMFFSVTGTIFSHTRSEHFFKQNTISSYSYGVCIRQEEGYCCVQYTPCSDSNSYSLDSSQATMAKQDDMCITDYVGIAGKTYFLQGISWQNDKFHTSTGMEFN